MNTYKKQIKTNLEGYKSRARRVVREFIENSRKTRFKAAHVWGMGALALSESRNSKKTSRVTQQFYNDSSGRVPIVYERYTIPVSPIVLNLCTVYWGNYEIYQLHRTIYCVGL